MNKKQFYTSPEVDVLVVRYEENIMSAKRVLLFTDWGTIDENVPGASIGLGDSSNNYGDF